MFGRRPKTPQGVGSPSAPAKGGSHAPRADVEVRSGAATPPSPRPAVPLPPNTVAAYACTLAGCMDETWVGRHVTFGSRDDVEVLAIEQHPTSHRTVLTVADLDGIESVDLHAMTAVITGTIGDLL